MTFYHKAGEALECLSVGPNLLSGLNDCWLQKSLFYFCFRQIPITLHKETVYDQEGREVHRCGFKIGGGIDQDYRKSPQNYSDNVSFLPFNKWLTLSIIFFSSSMSRVFMWQKFKRILQLWKPGSESMTKYYRYYLFTQYIRNRTRHVIYFLCGSGKDA